MASSSVRFIIAALIALTAQGAAADPTPDAGVRGDAADAARDADGRAGLQHPAPPPAAHHPASPQPPGSMPRWLDDVRAQRQALQELRRASQDARKGEFLRRRQELRDQMATERRLFRNHGPWLEPMTPAPLPPFLKHRQHGFDDGGGEDGAAQYTPPGWDNGWYYNGW